MLKLADTQREFLRALMAAPNGAKENTFAAMILPSGALPQQRIDVYRNNVFSNYRGALQAVYPVVEQLVGAAFFRHAADQFIIQSASDSGDLHDYGVGFALFLERYAPAAALVYLPDVARLEWLYHRVFHAAESAVDMSALTQTDPDNYAALRFDFHPAAALLRSAYPIFRIWQVNQADYDGDQSVSLEEGGDNLLVSREAFTVRVEQLPPSEYEFLAALQMGDTLGDALEAALVRDAQFDLQRVLAKHIASATIVRVTPS